MQNKHINNPNFRQTFITVITKKKRVIVSVSVDKWVNEKRNYESFLDFY